MRFPLTKASSQDAFNAQMNTCDTLRAFQDAVRFYKHGKTDNPEYVGRDPEKVLERSLETYLSAKKKYQSLARKGGYKNSGAETRFLEEAETVERQSVPEKYRGLLADLGPEVVAERNRGAEWYLDKWRKARHPGIYTPDTIDMRCANLPVDRMAYDGGVHLPETNTVEFILNEILMRNEEHKARADFAYGDARLN
jgi:hypothetical protein